MTVTNDRRKYYADLCRLQRAIPDLPKGFRCRDAALILAFVGGCSVEDLAQRFALTEGATVYRLEKLRPLVDRCRAALPQLIEEEKHTQAMAILNRGLKTDSEARNLRRLLHKPEPHKSPAYSSREEIPPRFLTEMIDCFVKRQPVSRECEAWMERSDAAQKAWEERRKGHF